MTTSLLSRRLKKVFASLGMALCIVLPWASTQADDLDIYTRPLTLPSQAPLTMLALDLNLLDVQAVACSNVLLPPSAPEASNPENAGCAGLQQLLTLGTLLGTIEALPGNVLGGAVPGLLNSVGFLVPDLLNNTVFDLLNMVATVPIVGPLVGGLLGAIGSVLSSNNLLQTLSSTLPVYLMLSNILHELIDTRVGIMLNHGDASAAPPAPCAFADQSNLGGLRQQTMACSNGGYVFLGLLDLTRVDQLLGKVLPLLLSAVGNLLNGSTLSNPLSTTPYQTKELYVELMRYLAGGPIFNGGLGVNDNLLAKTLVRDQTIETGNNPRNYVSALQTYPQACNINFLHVQLTPSAKQDESDDELRRFMPDAASREPTGVLSLANVVNTAANEGFVYAGDRRRIKSYFLVQESVGNLGDLSAVRSLGTNVTTYSNLLGLVGRGRDIAGAMLKPLSVDASLTSLTVAASRSSSTGILESAYVPVFRADVDQKPDWPGNLKRFTLRKQAGDNPRGLLEAVDARSPARAAIASNGRISPTALSVWTNPTRLGTATADGPVADLGGAGQNLPGFQFGGGGNPGRSNPAAPSTTVRTLFFDSYTEGAQLAALNPDDPAVRSELATATSATGFSAGNSACSTACNQQASTCLNQCSGTQGSCNNACVGTENSCNSSCGIGQGNCATGCGSSLASCIATANNRQTTCNSNAAATRTQCNSNAENAQALCVAPAALVRTTCNTIALTAKTTRDLLCLGDPTCLANSNDTYDAALATCTSNYNSNTAPCTANYNNAITACTNNFNTTTAGCAATRNSDIETCNANNSSCTNGCNSNASTCGLACGADAGSCTNLCTGNSNSCNSSCSAQLGSCQAACGVDTTRTGDTEVKELLLYARGFDVGTLANPKGSGSTPATKTDTGIGSRPWMMGAVLHSRPVAINYGKSDGAANDDVRVVFGSADGYLRMVNDRTGVESWGFMPQAVMKNLKSLRDNVPGSALPYGVDGSPIVLIRDRAPTTGTNAGKFGIIGDVVGNPSANPPVEGDRVLLFFGLRRGGSAYYAMDITDPDAPQLLWKLSPEGLTRAGQTAPDAGSATQFAALGLAFSTPQLGRIQLTVDAAGAALATPRTQSVLIFGGGYSGGRVGGAKVGKDLNNSRNAVATARVGRDDGEGSADRGNALFMVDAASGQLLWRSVRSAGTTAGYTLSNGTRSYAHPMLVDSIPSDLTVLDTDNDGLTDRLYVGDTGGRLWRADFPGGQPSAWTMTPIASVGRHNSGNSTLANDRRIFFAPDVVPVRNAGNTQGTDLVLFGTGDREDPLNLVTQNSFYVLRDTDIVSGKAAGEIVLTEEASALAQHSDFVDTTNGTALTDVTSLTQAGYRVNYTRTGEKHFSASVTLGGISTFTSYVPPDASAAGGRVCAPQEGNSRLYAVATRTGQARGINNSTQTDRDIALADGLPGEVNPLAGTQQAAGALIYAIPAVDKYRASWRERLGETQK